MYRMDKFKINGQDSFFFYLVQQPPVGQSLFIHEVSRSHNEAPQSVGLLWTGDQPDRESSTLQTHKTHSRQTFMPLLGFEPTITVGEWPADLRLRPRGHWDRHRPGVTGVQMSTHELPTAHTNNVI